MSRSHALTLAFVLALAAALRLYHLASVPTELIADELDLYNSVYSIATTGHDVDGSLRPYLAGTVTRNPPIYGIASYFSVLVFGRNAWGIRVPAVLFGLASILLLYAIVLQLTGRRDASLAAAALMAVQPLFVQFSRVGWEPASELPFLLGGVYALLRAFRPGSPIAFAPLAAAAVLLGLTAYTYMGGWFYAAALGLAALALNAARFQKIRDWIALTAIAGLWSAIAAPALQVWFFDPYTADRTRRIATFASGVNAVTLWTFVRNYFSHFRWDFLVTTGDPQPGVTWRYLNGFGAFYWWFVLLAVLGLPAIARYVRSRWALQWCYFWLLLYPFGGSLTNEGPPNAPRVLAGAPVFCILAAAGAVFVLDAVRAIRRPRFRAVGITAAWTAFACLTVLSTVLFSRYYFTRYVHRNSNAWDSGTHATFSTIRILLPRYRKVCLSIYPGFYQVDTYVRFYLNGMRKKVDENIAAPECFARGALLVVDNDHPVRRFGFRPVLTVTTVDGSPFARFSARPGRRGRGASQHPESRPEAAGPPVVEYLLRGV